MKLRKELNDKVVEAIESYNKGGLGAAHLSGERLTFEERKELEKRGFEVHCDSIFMDGSTNISIRYRG